MSGKQRLDKLLVSLGKFESREKARSAVMAGLVFVNGQRVDKPGYQVNGEAKIDIRGKLLPYVSRGGLKLEKAIKSFNIDLTGKVVMDIGASTGGFTDCALQNGAEKVYSVDVGYGQLAWSLRQDPRVVVLERTNIRYLTADKLEELPNFVTIDVSFISLSKVFPKLTELTTADASGVALIKPQFEAGRERVGKKGVVRDPAVHQDVINNVLKVVRQLGFQVLGLDYSPVRGPEGNIEYLLHFTRDNSSGGLNDKMIDNNYVSAVVKTANAEL
ncbi:23S rRNA (cytidine1920-2'-O)/16S rRNA (cytidine1409-2'-O)-methyltransferase [Desulfohalotomaculum tongense]|uniref:TlyA family RNA methyltransferase n=1 Tax=Desulforadius tongensis TaxID=1216062 RepID=UPI0019588B80|nr:TlyA family RNA methyltransferase [Desulforadius tongensis]MBM7855500.1 23S rRNA (cytidine1920-2'-O)/16S rRNA (cytidine1409-2'-O)-methyltransferase [Desulforadius tongensis]